jgi:hypothetical protein
LLKKTIDVIRARRDDFERRFGIRLVGVVGSVARGEERPDSDVDVVYDISGRPTLFDLVDAMYELEEALGRQVELIDPKALRPKARAFIERDLVHA